MDNLSFSNGYAMEISVFRITGCVSGLMGLKIIEMRIIAGITVC